MKEIKVGLIPAQQVLAILCGLTGLCMAAYTGGSILALAFLLTGIAAIGLARQRIPFERFDRIEAELERLEVQISKVELVSNDRVISIEKQISQTRVELDRLKAELYIPKGSTGLGVGAMSAVLLALVIVGIGAFRLGTTPRAVTQSVQPISTVSSIVSSLKPTIVPILAADPASFEIGKVAQSGQTAAATLQNNYQIAPLLLPTQQITSDFIYRDSGRLNETPRASLSLNTHSVITPEEATVLAEQRWNSRNSVAFRVRGASATIERLDPSISTNLATL